MAQKQQGRGQPRVPRQGHAASQRARPLTTGQALPMLPPCNVAAPQGLSPRDW
jgi:hypothetical protein